MRKNVISRHVNGVNGKWREELNEAVKRTLARRTTVPGLPDPNQRMDKGALKNAAYWFFGVAPTASTWMARRLAREWVETAVRDHRRWQQDLESSLAKYNLGDKLKRFEHHLSHAANAYLASGMERALIITLDGYGTGLAGSVSIGEGGKIKRLQNIKYPCSLGRFYENVTAALGYKPDRHAGKIVGLAAYGDPSVLGEVLLGRFKQANGEYQILDALNYFFDRFLATKFTMIDVAAAYQHVLEVVATNLVDYWVRKTGCANVVLSGGVTANVKMNQRIFEVPGVENIFVYPNMGDGGCGTGLALHLSLDGRMREPLNDAYLGPEYTDSEMEKALRDAGLQYKRPNNIAGEVARKIHQGRVVARFGGRMEYGPRALGNRSILFHAKDPEVNQWLNQRLGRTEFMPFAPVTPWEDRYDYYENLSGAEHAAQFMTVTFDCTAKMKDNCPAAVHIDGTARPQLVRREVNPIYYDILREHEKLSGISTLINTSYNMHEEPIVCTPADAVRAFPDGRLDTLALGPFLVESESTVREPGGSASSEPTSVHSTPVSSELEILDQRRMSDGCQVAVKKISGSASIKALWLELQGRSDYSFFQSWTWISAWLDSSPDDADMLLLEARREERIVGLAVLGHNTIRRHNIFSSEALLVSESGNPTYDALTVEHSGLLIERGIEVPVIRSCLEFLRDTHISWDEFYVSGIENTHPQSYIEAASSVSNLEPVVSAERPYFFVDLAAIEASEKIYLETLSANTRYQISRSKRLYEEFGPLSIRSAKSLDEAYAMFSRMKKLHQYSWNRRGHPGAFLSHFSNRFHTILIESGHPRGEIQLLAVTAGSKTFGYLYNFVLDGMVSNYQSGLLYEEDSKFKPGLVSHALAIEHNLGLGHKAYDLLMGDQRFKRSLTTHDANMGALIVHKNRFKFHIESKLQGIWDHVNRS